MTLAEMKEFAGFSAATQRYIRRVARYRAGSRRRDGALVARRGRSGQHPRPGADLRSPARNLRAMVPDDSGLDAIEPFMAPLMTLVGVRSRAGAADHLFGLSLPVRAADRRRGAAVAARGVLRGGGAAASPSRPAAQAAPVDQRSGGDRVGLVEPPAGLLPAMGREGR